MMKKYKNVEGIHFPIILTLAEKHLSLLQKFSNNSEIRCEYSIVYGFQEKFPDLVYPPDWESYDLVFADGSMVELYHKTQDDWINDNHSFKIKEKISNYPDDDYRVIRYLRLRIKYLIDHYKHLPRQYLLGNIQYELSRDL